MIFWTWLESSLRKFKCQANMQHYISKYIIYHLLKQPLTTGIFVTTVTIITSTSEKSVQSLEITWDFQRLWKALEIKRSKDTKRSFKFWFQSSKSFKDLWVSLSDLWVSLEDVQRLLKSLKRSSIDWIFLWKLYKMQNKFYFTHSPLSLQAQVGGLF